jgi:hypothetical protein
MTYSTHSSRKHFYRRQPRLLTLRTEWKVNRWLREPSQVFDPSSIATWVIATSDGVAIAKAVIPHRPSNFLYVNEAENAFRENS